MRHTTAVITRRYGWRLAAFFWFLFGLITGVQVWISMIDHHHYVPLLLGYYLFLWETWLIPTAAIVWLSRRFPVIPIQARNLAVHAVAAIAIAAAHTLFWVGLMLVVRPFDRLTATASDLRL